MTSDWLKEAGRKTFHQLSLVFLIFYYWLGYPRVLRWMIPWTIFAVTLETARLLWAPLNDFLFRLLGVLARGDERTHYSGIVYTTFGAFLLFLLFGNDPRLVAAGLFCVSLGDTAAALVGKWIGRHKILSGKKSFEGSAACYVTCAAVGAFAGFPAGSAAAAAAAATIIEFLPTTVYFNDNMWMAVGVAATLRICAA